MTTVITRGAGSAQALGYAARATAANYIEDVFSTYLYTGNGSTQTITNGIDLSGKGGLVWIKNRPDAATAHALFDTVRGATKYLQSQATSAEGTQATSLTAFNSNGYSLGAASFTNNSGTNYASWTFRKQAKFFDVVTYTGTGANRTISHNLGSVPGCIIVKRTDTTGNWCVYHRSLGGGTAPGTDVLFLNTTDSVTTASSYWNDTTATSTVFSLGTTTAVNANGGTYVAYLFAHDAGGFGASGADNVITCGSYVGNGTGSGPIVTLGYEPQWIMVKDITNSVQDWVMQDVMRGMTVTAGEGLYLRANSSAPDAANSYFTPFATGFQPNQASGQANASGRTYIYIAIRRGPMRTPTSGTSVFSPLLNDGSSIGKVMTTGFPVDLQFANTRTTNAMNTGSMDRLRGVSTTPANFSNYTPYLLTSSTGAEATDKLITNGWGNTGFLIPYESYSNNTSVFYNFRRAPGFFDEVCYTGTGANTTQAHNLGVVPEFIIVKNRGSGSAYNWTCYHSALGNGNRIRLNTTAASSADATAWNSTTPTSSVFSIGTDSGVNFNTMTYVAYLFATCPGVSKVGSYTGTGALQTVNCGFTSGARFVLIKRTDSTGDWYVWDSARGIVAGNDSYLVLNSTAAEVTNTDYVDTYSAGFEISSTAPAAINANGGTFIFLAIA